MLAMRTAASVAFLFFALKGLMLAVDSIEGADFLLFLLGAAVCFVASALCALLAVERRFRRVEI